MKQFLFCLILFFSASVEAQELNCQVSIISDAKLEINSTEQDALTQLKQIVTDIMNNTQLSTLQINSGTIYLLF